MKKALLYRLMKNIDQLVYKTGLSHSAVSDRIGSAKNWFNDAYNNNEDIYISSFTKVLSVIDGELDLSKYNLIDIFDRKIFKIVSLMHYLSDNDVAYLDTIIAHDPSAFVELIADWKSMDYRKKLSDVEKHNLNEIVLKLSKGDA